MSVTGGGRFRPELIGAAGLRDAPAGSAPTQQPPAAGASSGSGAQSAPYAGWVDRVQRTRSRHAAITRNLYTWSSYKNWTERVRDSWSGDAAANEPDQGKRGR